MNRYFGLATADLIVPNQEAWGLLMDFATLRELADSLPGNTSLQNKALVTANEIMNVLNKNDLGSISRARKLAEEVLGKDWEKKQEKVYTEGAKRPQVWGIGYCHIDTAWFVAHSARVLILKLIPSIGYGRTVSRSRRSPVHGPLKSIS